MIIRYPEEIRIEVFIQWRRQRGNGIGPIGYLRITAACGSFPDNK